MKTYNFIIFILILVASQSCSRCDKFIDCPQLSQQYQNLLHYQIGDSLVYKSDGGNTKIFVVRHRNLSRPERQNCFSDYTNGNCKCNSCEAIGYLEFATEDSSWLYVDPYDSNHIVVSTYWSKRIQERDGISECYISFASEPINFDIHPFSLISSNQVIITDYISPFHTYHNVIHQQVDTNLRPKHYNPPQAFVSDIYVHALYGVIAYKERKSQEIFYLK